MDPDIFSERQKSIFGSNVNGVAHLAPETVLIPIKCGTLKGDSHGISDVKIPSVNKSCKDAELCIATFTKGYFEELGNPQTSSQYVYLGCRGFRYLLRPAHLLGIPGVDSHIWVNVLNWFCEKGACSNTLYHFRMFDLQKGISGCPEQMYFSYDFRTEGKFMYTHGSKGP